VSIRKRGFFRPGKEIKGLRGGIQLYAAEVSPQIDAAKAEKDRFSGRKPDSPACKVCTSIYCKGALHHDPIITVYPHFPVGSGNVIVDIFSGTRLSPVNFGS